MNTKGLSRASMLLIAAGALYGCADGDESNINITSTGGGTSGPSQTPTSSCPDWSLARPQDDDGNDVCQLPAEIMDDRVLTSDKVWYMASRVTVGNGNQRMSAIEGVLDDTAMTPVENVTLTVEAGTEIKARTGSFANLIITRGSQIDANGTSALPIIFSSDDDGYDGTGEWGGLILHGYATHNDDDCVDGTTACNVDSEGESGWAGGNSDDDSSGTLRYVVVTEGGFEFAVGNEINGISLVGVGAGTTLEYIQVNSNADDGVEFYGGTVNGKYFVLTGNLDDTVDWDEGYQGNLQHILVIQSPDTDGNIIEADTRGDDSPLSKPTIANGTFVGAGSQTTGAVFKALSGGFMHHSVITGVTTCVSTSASVKDASAGMNQNINALAFTNVVADCPTSGDTDLIPAPIGDVALDANLASQAAEASAVGALDIAAYNALNIESVADPAFFDDTDYAGAVNPDGSDNWYEGWTLDGTVVLPMP